MLMNNLDEAVAENPRELIVYGGSGKAARNWDCYRAIVRALRRLENDETLLVQSGKPVGVFRTFEHAPRVLIANSNLVGNWANWDEFNRLERLGLIMYGQMTAGSWIYIGSQGIVQGTFETFAAAARKHFGSSRGAHAPRVPFPAPSRETFAVDEGVGRGRSTQHAGARALPQIDEMISGLLRGRLVISGGLGGMGGAQPLAATMNGAAFLGVEIDPARIEKRLRTGYCDRMTASLDEALDLVLGAKKRGEALSVGLVGNCAEVLPELVRRGVTPDLLTDQTSAHDPLNGYVPAGLSLKDALELRKKNPDDYVRRAMDSIAAHVRAMLDMQKAGAVTFDYGNNIRTMAHKAGVKDAYDFPGFVQAYIRPLFCEGRGPFRWAALSGDPADIAATDKLILELFPRDKTLARWIPLAQKKIKFQGLPARICWLGCGERALMGLRMNELVRKKKVKAPFVIGRDHLDAGSVASPFRETEGMKDGSDAIADWPILNALLNTASGASWVSFHHGGGVGIGYSLHAGQVVVCDGTKEVDARIERVLTNDPAIGVVRHADAGYGEAKRAAKKHKINIPKSKL